MTDRRDPNSLTSRVERWFADNPDEELTFSDLCIKFDAPVQTLRGIVKLLPKRGTLERVEVYRLPRGRAT